MKKFRAILVDDSDEARKLLRMMIQFQSPEIELCGEAANANQGIELIRTAKPDIVFLDIEMPNMSGIQMLKEIPREIIPYEVIFTTAYHDYAIFAFRLSAIDYLLKPINESHLLEAIEKVKKKLTAGLAEQQLKTLENNLIQGREKKLCVPVFNGFEYFHLNEIEFIEASGSYALIHLTNGKTKTISKNLKYFNLALEGVIDFIRVHRSYMINLQHMQRFSKNGRGTLTMKSGTEIDLARERREEFFAAIKQRE